MRAMAQVAVRLGNDGTATLRASKATPGATFVVPAPNLRVLIDGQPAKGTLSSKTETTFWVDLPEGKPVRVELLDARGKQVSILKTPAHKSLLAGLPPPASSPVAVPAPVPMPSPIPSPIPSPVASPIEDPSIGQP
jgi:hypothetical protein